MRKSWLFIVVFLLSLSMVSADADWDSFSNGNQNLGRADTSFYNEFNTQNATDSAVAAGSGFQILGIDLDNNGDIEMLAANGNYLQLYQASGAVYSLEDEVLMSGSQDSVGWAGDVDGDLIPEYIVSFDDVIYTVEWNGSDFNTSRSYNVTSAGYTTETGIVCDNYAGSYACYAGSSNSQMIEYNPNTGGGSIYNMSTPDFDCANCPYHAPLSFDIDNDGKKEIGFIGAESYAVIEQQGPSVDWSWAPSIGSTSYKVYGALAYNLDGAGDTETCFTWSDDRTAGTLHTSHLTCLNGDASEFNDTTVYEDLSGPGINYVGISNPVIADVDGTGDVELCVVHANQGTGTNKKRTMVTCYSVGSALSTFDTYNVQEEPSHFVGDAETAGTVTEILASGRVKSSDREALVYGDSIFYYESAQFFRDNASNKFSNASKAKSIMDTNGNGFVEIIESFTSSMTAWFTDATNTPPEVNNTLSYGGYGANYDYNSPICQGTTITFSAQECGGDASCNYQNDGTSDLETIRTNCGNFSNPETNLVNGTSSLANPQYSCYFNSTGSKTVRLYLEDDKNKGDLTEYNTQNIIVNVIAGTPGVTCNFAGFDVADQVLTPATAAQEQVDNSIEATMGLLTGTSTTMKLIVGIGLIFAIVTGVAAGVPTMASSGLFMGVIVFLAIGFVSLFGLLPFWVMILLMAGCSLIILFSVMMGRNNGSG